MAKNDKVQKSGHSGGDNVVQLVTKCTAQDCKAKPSVAGFCDEHFLWFKEGLLTKSGAKPIDFDKKLVGFLNRKKAA